MNAFISTALTVLTLFAVTAAAVGPGELVPCDLSSSAPPSPLRGAAARAGTDISATAFGRPGSEVPTMLAPSENRLIRRDDGGYVFESRRGRDTFSYRFRPAAGFPDGLEITRNGRPVNGGKQPFELLFSYARVKGRSGSGSQGEDETASLKTRSGSALVSNHARFRRELVRVEPGQRELTCLYRYTARRDPKESFELKVALRQDQGSLLAAFSCAKPVIAQVRLKLRGGDPVFFEYYTGSYPCYFAASNSFVGIFPLTGSSDASSLLRDGTQYNPLTDGSRRCLKDTFCITAAAHLEELFPNSVYPASPYRSELSRRVVLDFWDGDFAWELRFLESLRRYGMDSLLVISHVWQNKGFDRSNPNMLPANPALGGDAGLRKLAEGARRLGHRFAIHENYYDIVPGNEDYRESFLCRNSDGTFIPRLGGHGQFVKPSKHLDYVRKFSADAARRYHCSAVFHDVMPHWKVDYEASDPEAGIFRLAIERQRDYFALARQLVDGPVSTEMIASPMAGAWDTGGNAYMNNLADRKPMSAFALLKVFSKMRNYSAGYYERWHPWGYRPGWDRQVMTDREIDRYRAMELAFGRLGFIGRQLINSGNDHAMAREYYLMQAANTVIGSAMVKQVGYYVRSQGWSGWVDSAGAAALRQWDRLRIVFTNGTTLLINYSASPWAFTKRTLPPWSFCLSGPGGEVYTALVDGQVADFAAAGDRVYADARSHVWTPPASQPGLGPSLHSWRDLGNGRFELSVSWKPEWTPIHDFSSFWEFKEADTAASRPVFLYNHAMKTPPASGWKPGTTYCDGPHTLEVKGGKRAYDLIVGLTHLQGKAPRPLVFRMLNKVRIARLEVDYDAAGKPVALRFRNASPELPPGSEPGEHLRDANRSRRLIDFGRYATDGAFILRGPSGSRELIPVPLGTAMRIGLEEPVGTVVAVDAKGGSRSLAVVRKDGKSYFEIPGGIEKVMLK